MRHLQVSVYPRPGRDAGLLNPPFLVTSCLVASFFSLLVGFAATGPDFHGFAGTWRGNSKARPLSR
jgi:hypothetical protein